MPLSLAARFWRAVLRRALKMRKVSIPEVRRREARAARMLRRLPGASGIEWQTVGGVRCAWLKPPGAAREAAVIYLHGGGYVLGSPDSHIWMCGPMAKVMNLDFVLPDYRLAPEHPFPASLEDAAAVYRELLSQGYAPRRILLAGDSAGGGLALALALKLRDEGAPAPAGILCLSPWTDLTTSGGSHVAKAGAEAILTTETLQAWARAYAPAAELAHPLVSPVFGEYHGLPPLHIQVGSEEILLDDSLAVAAKARSAGVSVTLKVWNGLWHVWPALSGLVPESRLAIEEMARFSRGLGLH